MLVTGMIVGTAFTLLVVPSIYVLVARTHPATVPEENEVKAGPEGAELAPAG